MNHSDHGGHGPLSPDTALDVGYGLGWFSIGLGLAELIAPQAITRMLGMRGSEALVQAYGVREIATGVAILSSNNPAPWLWARVAGDALDMATVSAALGEDNPKRDNAGIALAALAGVTVLDVLTARALSGEDPRREREEQRRRHMQRLAAYGRRSGFPRSADAMRGAAGDFQTPPDYSAPAALRPWVNGRPATASISG